MEKGPGNSYRNMWFFFVLIALLPNAVAAGERAGTEGARIEVPLPAEFVLRLGNLDMGLTEHLKYDFMDDFMSPGGDAATYTDRIKALEDPRTKRQLRVPDQQNGAHIITTDDLKMVAPDR